MGTGSKSSDLLRSSVDSCTPVRVALFDFDGTLSTLRQGWEQVMEPLMLEILAGPTNIDDDLVKMVRSYIDQSTGIQTSEQMRWLTGKARELGRNPEAPADPWQCKDIYIERLHHHIRSRRQQLEQKAVPADTYLIAGSLELLDWLKHNHVAMYLASGSDEADIIDEAELLGIRHFFEIIAGAKPFDNSCAKEKVIRELLETQQVPAGELVVIGDGPVEIQIGRQIGARTLGLASDEKNRRGFDPRKHERLIKAGAERIIGDFLPESLKSIPEWLGLNQKER